MKKILAMAAVAALAAGASAYAANPFADVSTSDWAYQAVADLSDQGIVEGYPDGTFKGQTNITRYEMAQIIARLMAKEDQYNAEQRATIDPANTLTNSISSAFVFPTWKRKWATSPGAAMLVCVIRAKTTALMKHGPAVSAST